MLGECLFGFQCLYLYFQTILKLTNNLSIFYSLFCTLQNKKYYFPLKISKSIIIFIMQCCCSILYVNHCCLSLTFISAGPQLGGYSYQQ